MADNTTWTVNYWYDFIENSSNQHATAWGRWMRLIGLPIVFLIGFPGNIISMAVMSRQKMRRCSYSIILISLAVFDISSLVIRLLFWINLLQPFLYGEDHEAVITIRTVAGCKASEYMFTSIHIVCAWLVAILSIERFIVISFPIRGRQWCRPKTSRMAVVILIVSAFTLQIYSAVFSQYIPGIGCAMTASHQYTHFIVATTFVTFAPLTLIFLSNCMIICLLIRSRSTGSGTPKDTRVRRATYMLLSVSTAFYILVFPNALVVLLLVLQPGWQPVLSVVLEPLALLWDINFGINFYCYVLSGREVRHEVLRMFGYRKEGEPQGYPGSPYVSNHRQGVCLDTDSGVTSRNTSMLSCPSSLSIISGRSNGMDQM